MTEPSAGVSSVWKKSSCSVGGGCVEVRRTDSGVQVRDSKNVTGPTLEFTDYEWRSFIGGVRLGEVDIDAPDLSSAK